MSSVSGLNVILQKIQEVLLIWILSEKPVGSDAQYSCLHQPQTQLRQQKAFSSEAPGCQDQEYCITVCCGYLAGFLASKDLGIEIPELLIHLSLLLLHDLVHNLRQRQVVLLHHQILNTSHDKVAALADEVAEHGDRLGGSLTTGSCCFNHLAALSCSTLPQLHE